MGAWCQSSELSSSFVRRFTIDWNASLSIGLVSLILRLVLCHSRGPMLLMCSVRSSLPALRRICVIMREKIVIWLLLILRKYFCRRLSRRPSAVSSGCWIWRPPLSKLAERRFAATSCLFCIVVSFSLPIVFPTSCTSQEKEWEWVQSSFLMTTSLHSPSRKQNKSTLFLISTTDILASAGLTSMFVNLQFCASTAPRNWNSISKTKDSAPQIPSET